MMSLSDPDLIPQLIGRELDDDMSSSSLRIPVSNLCVHAKREREREYMCGGGEEG